MPCFPDSAPAGAQTILNALRVALGIISGKIILNFGVQESLRTFLNPIFTGGVVEENGRCRAAFCESAARRNQLSACL